MDVKRIKKQKGEAKETFQYVNELIKIRLFTYNL